MDKNIKKYADVLGALGNEARLCIIKLLIGAYPGELSAGDLGTQTSIPGSTLSHHLERLHREGIITRRKEKQWIWYSANLNNLNDLLAFLYQDCCDGKCDMK